MVKKENDVGVYKIMEKALRKHNSQRDLVTSSATSSLPLNDSDFALHASPSQVNSIYCRSKSGNHNSLARYTNRCARRRKHPGTCYGCSLHLKISKFLCLKACQSLFGGPTRETGLVPPLPFHVAILSTRQKVPVPLVLSVPSVQISSLPRPAFLGPTL